MKKYWYFFKHKIIPTCIAFLGKKILALLTKTYKIHVTDLDHYLTTARNEKCLVMLWHNKLVLAPTILYKFGSEFNYGVLVSKSRDGEIIASIIDSYGIAKCIRVAHNAKKNALDEALAFINQRQGVVVITPDGPKGPPFRIKKGTAYLAKVSGAHIVPMSWSTTKYWQLKTWDKLMIPKPFSTIQVCFGPPLILEENNNQPLEVEIELIEKHINSIF